MDLINVFKEISEEKYEWFANGFAEVFHGRKSGSCVGWTRGCDGIPSESHTSSGLRFGGRGASCT